MNRYAKSVCILRIYIVKFWLARLMMNCRLDDV